MPHYYFLKQKYTVYLLTYIIAVSNTSCILSLGTHQEAKGLPVYMYFKRLPGIPIYLVPSQQVVGAVWYCIVEVKLVGKARGPFTK